MNYRIYGNSIFNWIFFVFIILSVVILLKNGANRIRYGDIMETINAKRRGGKQTKKAKDILTKNLIEEDEVYDF